MFQSTRPRRARPDSQFWIYDDGGFNPRAREGRDCRRLWSSIGAKMFQSTRPRRARPAATQGLLGWFVFQSTRPRRARPGTLGQPGPPRLSFNPRAREGRDPIAAATPFQTVLFQSTRPRRARPKHFRLKDSMIEFQSTRPRRARRGQELTCHAWQVFQSTRPRRARRRREGVGIPDRRVSIHAPAKGATTTAGFWEAHEKFQSTRPRRARRLGIGRGGASCEFQSTRPRRARLNFRLDSTLMERFNPRAREGRDYSPRHGVPGRFRFNPRAREGRDRIQGVSLEEFGEFQSTRPRRARQGRARPTQSCLKFQSTRPRRARRPRLPIR